MNPMRRLIERLLSFWDFAEGIDRLADNGGILCVAAVPAGRRQEPQRRGGRRGAGRVGFP
jgi:hypothetical protein